MRRDLVRARRAPLPGWFATTLLCVGLLTLCPSVRCGERAPKHCADTASEFVELVSEGVEAGVFRREGEPSLLVVPPALAPYADALPATILVYGSAGGAGAEYFRRFSRIWRKPERLFRCAPLVIQSLIRIHEPQKRLALALLLVELANQEQGIGRLALEQPLVEALPGESSEVVTALYLELLKQVYSESPPRLLDEILAEMERHETHCVVMEAYAKMLGRAYRFHPDRADQIVPAIDQLETNQACQGAELVAGQLYAFAEISRPEAIRRGLELGRHAIAHQDATLLLAAAAPLTRLTGSGDVGQRAFIRLLGLGLDSEETRIRALCLMYLETNTELAVGYLAAADEQVYDGFLATYDFLTTFWDEGMPVGAKYDVAHQQAIEFWKAWLAENGYGKP